MKNYLLAVFIPISLLVSCGDVNLSGDKKSSYNKLDFFAPANVLQEDGIQEMAEGFVQAGVPTEDLESMKKSLWIITNNIVSGNPKIESFIKRKLSDKEKQAWIDDAEAMSKALDLAKELSKNQPDIDISSTRLKASPLR